MEETNKEQKEPFYKNKNFVSLAVLILLLIAFAVYVKGPDIGPIFGSGVSAEEAKAKVEKLIGENNPGVMVKGVTEESGLYKVTIGVESQPDQYAYVTKDGKKFIQQAIEFSEIEKQQEEQKKADEEANKPVEKSDKPTVDLYVMSFCPYGNKAEDTLKPAYDLLKDKANFNFHYIVTSSGDDIQSLHGAKEVDQDEREACVLKNYGKDKWFSLATYVNANCGSDGSCWEAGAKAGGMDTVKINDCVKKEGVALMKADEEASNNAKASGSPTMRINGVSTKAVYQYGNSEAYKKAICDAFTAAPEECGQALSEATSTAQGGSCAN